VEWSEELSGGLRQAAPDPILVMDEGYLVLSTTAAGAGHGRGGPGHD
jgi:hypothetical protein